MSYASILIADDDQGIRTVLSQALGRMGHDVRTTSNAANLWRWVSDGDGDLVITDVIMPDENGLDLIPRIRKLRPDLRIIVMSAQSTLLTAIRATERGAFEYIPKPFDLKDLIEILFIVIGIFLIIYLRMLWMDNHYYIISVHSIYKAY